MQNQDQVIVVGKWLQKQAQKECSFGEKMRKNGDNGVVMIFFPIMCFLQRFMDANKIAINFKCFWDKNE